ncbi:unnamed protein product [Euphydryas editha]|uniref:Uncharacterized protein n=1 Tax=Euphydryas editha TaxID=104508 RepID=A0AAU9TS10_EUPED|nr:unnamed protein product [Euphydryas editha]
MADRNTSNAPYEDVAKGLNLHEMRSNTNIPYVDEVVELEHVRADEPIRPKRLRDVEKNLESSDLKEERKIHASDLGTVHSPNSDTIVVNTPEGTLYITLDPDSSKSSKPTSPSTQSTDISEATPTESKAFGALESDNLITVEKEVDQRRMNLRRNSISMPSLPNMEYMEKTQDRVSFLFL